MFKNSLSAKPRILALGILTFLYMFIALYGSGKGIVDFADFSTISVMFLMSIITVCTYVFVAPIVWNLTSRYHLLVRFAIAFVACLVTMAIYTFIMMGLVKFIGVGSSSFYRNFRFNLIVHMLPVMGFGYLISCWKQTDKERLELKKDLEITQALLLYSQLSPNSLFNSLYAVSEMIPIELTEVKESINSLAQYFQGLLRASDRQRNALFEERILIENYLKFISAKLQLRVLWTWDEAIDLVQLPPLLLQPLVENAIRHGIEENGILCIVAEYLPEGDLRLAVKNVTTLAALRLELVGHTVQNIKSRLKLTYGNKATFCLNYDRSWVTAEIVISKEALKFSSGVLPLPRILQHQTI